MRILKNRILKSFRGKGSKGDADVNYSLLNQPNGNFLQSNDFVKSLDLLCEGEIEGFINPQGYSVDGILALQAVYLNDVPILDVSTKSDKIKRQVIDSIAPTITILGDNPATIEVGTAYIDDGAFSNEGEIATQIINNVNTSVVGIYEVVFSATDSLGNVATETRIVNVVDTQAPVITILGDNPVTIPVGQSYVDLGATVVGGFDIITTNNVEVDAQAVYLVIYEATDDSGNTGTATRTVNVVDNIAPIITVLGDNPTSIVLGDTYVDAGATADGGETVTSSNNINTNQEGTYTVNYFASDIWGNTGTATRTVEVLGTTIGFYGFGFNSPLDGFATYNASDVGYTQFINITSGTRLVLFKLGDGRWEIKYFSNYGGTFTEVYYRTTSSYVSSNPRIIPRSDWVYVGPSGPFKTAGYIVDPSEIPNSSYTTDAAWFPDAIDNQTFVAVPRTSSVGSGDLNNWLYNSALNYYLALWFENGNYYWRIRTGTVILYQSQALNPNSAADKLIILDPSLASWPTKLSPTYVAGTLT